MSRKGYHLLTTQLSNSDSDEKAMFDSPSNAGNGWSDEEQNLNIFSDTTGEKFSNEKQSVELRSRNSLGTGKSSMDDVLLGPSSSEVGTRRSNGNGNGIVLLERRVRKDDTLQKLSLQFGIAVAELKRVNNFIADTDLYARDIIKIPVSKYSYNRALILAELDGGIPSTDLTTAASTASTSGVQVPSSAATAAAINGEPIQAEHLLKAVDANVLKAQRQLEQRQQSVLNDGVHEDIAEDARFPYLDNSQSRNAGNWLERNVRHYLALILIIVLIIGLPPVIFIIIKVKRNSSGVTNDSQHTH